MGAHCSVTVFTVNVINNPLSLSFSLYLNIGIQFNTFLNVNLNHDIATCTPLVIIYFSFSHVYHRNPTLAPVLAILGVFSLQNT